jgi:hypothetical protein
MTEQRACSEVTIPALLTEMLCCSIASWMETLHRRGNIVSATALKGSFYSRCERDKEACGDFTCCRVRRASTLEKETYIKQRLIPAPCRCQGEYTGRCSRDEIALNREVKQRSHLSWSFILSNSSMRHMPRSASTSAPPSRVHSRVMGSLCTPAVSPTADAPFPVV